MPETPVTVILLAGQRAGVVNPLAERAGVSHKCLVPIGGRPLIAHVLDTVTALPAVSEVRISLEPGAHDSVAGIAAEFIGRGTPIRLVRNERSIVESINAAVGDDPGPFVVTTADNVLLTPAAVAQIRSRMEEVDAVMAFARKANVLAAHPEGQRGFYRFRDDEYANCNIYGLANREAVAAGERVFRGGGQFMKSLWRMIRAFGPINILLLRLGAFDRESALRQLSRRLGITVEATEFTDGSLAIDVDNERTYRVCEELLAKRGAA